MKDKPLKLIRLVIQLADTKVNRRVMHILQDHAMKSIVQPPHASIKREDINIAFFAVTKGKDTP